MAFSLSLFPFSVELAGRSKCELKEDVLVLTDSLYQGRKCGSERMVDLSVWIAERFGQIGLEKYEGCRFLNFELSSGGIGRNVVGVMPGTSGKFIVVMAYYDALGVKDGVVYPGADSNASGVAVMLDVARLLTADGIRVAGGADGFGAGTGTAGGSNGIGAGAASGSSGRVTAGGLDRIGTGTGTAGGSNGIGAGAASGSSGRVTAGGLDRIGTGTGTAGGSNGIGAGAASGSSGRVTAGGLDRIGTGTGTAGGSNGIGAGAASGSSGRVTAGGLDRIGTGTGTAGGSNGIGAGAASGSSGRVTAGGLDRIGTGTGTAGGSNGIGAGAASGSSGRVTAGGLDRIGTGTGTAGGSNGRGKKYDGVIFVALDGHFDSYRGAECLLRSIQREKIRMVVNLDTLGDSSSPIDKARPRYLMALGGERYSKTFDKCTQAGKLQMYYEYYRSESFTRMFYRRLGDQTVFLNAGIRSIVFTSGISMDTNKPTDTADKLDYNALRYRSLCIARWLALTR